MNVRPYSCYLLAKLVTVQGFQEVFEGGAGPLYISRDEFAAMYEAAAEMQGTHD